MELVNHTCCDFFLSLRERRFQMCFPDIWNDKSVSKVYILSLTKGLLLLYQVRLDSLAVSGLLQRSTAWSKWTEGQTIDWKMASFLLPTSEIEPRSVTNESFVIYLQCFRAFRVAKCIKAYQLDSPICSRWSFSSILGRWQSINCRMLHILTVSSCVAVLCVTT